MHADDQRGRPCRWPWRRLPSAAARRTFLRGLRQPVPRLPRGRQDRAGPRARLGRRRDRLRRASTASRRGSVGQRLAVLEREHRIRGPVDHQGRSGIEDSGGRDRSSSVRASWFCAAVKLRARSTSRPTSRRAAVSSNERSVPGEHARVADQVLDHRLGVGPVDLGRRHELHERLGRRRKLARRPAAPGRC